MDFFERAKRLVELPLLEEQYEEQQTADKEFHTEQENQKVGTTWSCWALNGNCFADI